MFMGILILILLLMTAIIIINQRMIASKCKTKAKLLLESGEWQAASALYKKVIMERLGNLQALRELVTDLAEIYKQNGIEADLSKILECPELIKQIWNTKISPKEKSGLHVKLYGEIASILNKYPGTMDS